ncbi:MAG: hypothetical protein H6R06_3864, partial [Proteobacteria bacterium]|nr:hypothetical protein [Pseudomonadota bacterium]
DANALPVSRRQQALRRVAQRYARALRIGFNDLQDALNVASGRARKPRNEPAPETSEVDSKTQDTLA